jgi:hypothetical protein
MAPVMCMIDGRSLVSDEPGIVFSVKELIGRLDGKLDMMMKVLTAKADRDDVAALERRVGKVEDTVQAMNTAQEALTRARGDQINTTRWRLGAIVSIVVACTAIAAVIITLVLH